MVDMVVAKVYLYPDLMCSSLIEILPVGYNDRLTECLMISEVVSEGEDENGR